MDLPRGGGSGGRRASLDNTNTTYKAYSSPPTQPSHTQPSPRQQLQQYQQQVRLIRSNSNSNSNSPSQIPFLTTRRTRASTTSNTQRPTHLSHAPKGSTSTSNTAVSTATTRAPSVDSYMRQRQRGGPVGRHDREASTGSGSTYVESAAAGVPVGCRLLRGGATGGGGKMKKMMKGGKELEEKGTKDKTEKKEKRGLMKRLRKADDEGPEYGDGHDDDDNHDDYDENDEDACTGSSGPIRPWTKSCSECNRKLARWRLCYHCCFCGPSDSYLRCQRCGPGCRDTNHPVASVVKVRPGGLVGRGGQGDGGGGCVVM